MRVGENEGTADRFRITARETLARKLLWLVLPPVVAVLVLAQAVSYSTLRRTILQGIERDLGSGSAEAVLVVSNLFRQYANDLQTLSESSLIADYHKNADYGLQEEAQAYRRELRQFFSNFHARAKIYHRIALTDDRGRDIVAAGGPGGLAPALGAKMAASLRARPRQIHKLGIYESPTGRVLRWAKAVPSPLGEYKGALVLDCDVGSIEQLLGTLGVGKGGGAYLTGPDGAVIAGRPGLETMTLKARSPVPESNWEVVVAADRQEFLGPLNRAQRVTALVAAAAVAMLFVALWAGIRAGMAPLGRLLQAIRGLSRGESSRPIAVQGEDEIAVVSGAFNEMAHNLGVHRKALQDKIEHLLALHSLSEAIISRAGKDPILMTALSAAMKGLRFDRGGLYWIDREKGDIVGSCVYGVEGLSNEEMRARRIPLASDDILAHIVRSNEPAFIEDPTKDPRCNQAYVRETRTRAFCAVPIRGKQAVLGVIVADNYDSGRPIRPEDIQSLLVFANSAGAALENMALLDRIGQDEVRRRMILDNAVEAILSLDSGLRITTFNRGAQALFGYSPEEVLGRPVTMLFVPAAAEELVKHVVVAGGARNHDIEGLSKAGGLLHLNMTLAGAEEEASRNKEWAVVIRDVTGQKKLQNQLIQAEKLSAIGQLISGIAHEISNPLAAVVGYSQMSLLDNPPARIREDLKLIAENTDRCKKIMDNLLLFARQGQPVRKPFDLAEAVQNVRHLMQYQLEKKDKIRLSLELDPRARPILGDLQQIEQVLINLLKNACDAMHFSRGDKAIAVRSRQEGARLLVEVSDNGPGIAPDVLERIFEPFFTTKQAGKGTGLGLAISRQIVTDHGGSMTCRSGPAGTTFALILPTAAFAGAEPAAAEPGIGPCPGKRILIVEDERDLAALIVKLMRQDDDRAETVASGAMAMRRLAHRRYDLIITDMALGRLSGDRVLDYWDRRMKDRGTRALVITGDILNPAVLEAIKKYRVDYVTKPFALDDLRQKARRLLSAPAYHA